MEGWMEARFVGYKDTDLRDVVSMIIGVVADGLLDLPV